MFLPACVMIYCCVRKPLRSLRFTQFKRHYDMIFSRPRYEWKRRLRMSRLFTASSQSYKNTNSQSLTIIFSLFLYTTNLTTWYFLMITYHALLLLFFCLIIHVHCSFDLCVFIIFIFCFLSLRFCQTPLLFLLTQFYSHYFASHTNTATLMFQLSPSHFYALVDRNEKKFSFKWFK